MSLRTIRRITAFCTFIVAVAVPVSAAPALASTETVSVDLSTITGTLAHVGQGFLYGLSQDGSAPTDSLLMPLSPTSFRSGGALDVAGERGWAFGDSQFLPRYNMVQSQAQRVTRAPYNAKFDILVSDLWGSDGFPDRPSPITEPCDDGPSCAQWVAFLTELVGRLNADGLLNSSVRFDIWNEPDGSVFWPRSQSQYYDMWNVGVATLRSLDPGAIIEGPSYSSYNSATMASWLDQAQTAGTLPNILNWHFSSDPVTDAANARSLLSARSITGVTLSENEYLNSAQQTPAYTAWYLSRLQRSGISWASHAIWSNCCIDGSLDQILAPSGGQLEPTGQYWTYKAAAGQTGSLVASTGTGDLDLIANRNDTARTASILLGGNGTFTGTADLQINGLTATPYLVSNNQVHAVIQRMSPGLQDSPITVLDSMLPVSSGTATVPVPWTAAADAYEVTLVPGASTTATVDGNVKSGTDSFSYGANWGLTTGVSDMYDGTANWSFTQNATATFTFTGTKVWLYAAKAFDQGIMSVSLDGGTPINIDNYSATRLAASLAWDSPLLTLGTHTLTITNTGTKNPSSAGINIAIDRADVAS